MDPFAPFKAMFDQHNEICGKNRQLEDQKNDLQAEGEQLRKDNDKLRARVEELDRENIALRRVVQYGQRLVSKNQKRDEEMHEAFASALTGTLNEYVRNDYRWCPRCTDIDRQSFVTDATPESNPDSSTIEDQVTLQHGQDSTILCKVEDDEPTATTDFSLLSAIPYEIRLVDEIDADGHLTYCEISDLPLLVKESIVKNIQDAKTYSHPNTKVWKRLFTSDFQCATVANIGGGTHWVDGIVGKYACRICFVQKRACVVFDHDSQKLAVRPIPPTMRSKDAVAGTDDYYITTSDVSRRGAAKNGPWSGKQTNSTSKRKRDE